MPRGAPATEDACLFCFKDLAVTEGLGLYRERPMATMPVIGRRPDITLLVSDVADSAKNLDNHKDPSKQPVVFSKGAASVIGPGAAVEYIPACVCRFTFCT